ncbi:MAG: hypothetical protein BA872_09870 [Desulfobacterales bacterium C00003060]|nr:MAG: hypothetical protein BA861_03180 [Desulfobacterales bacterium S3730MH5]OEU79696.1 MAG: hypothetical protein BA872_09870 [Desulfobacterales bacterium C00003060]OEU80097.1 MAG: hypothetical protein BA865_09105 [Desulfobacterales bacterium S5133MH4]
MTHSVYGKIHKDVIVAIAITTLISVAVLCLGVLGPFVGLFFPVPILYYRLKLGRSLGLLILIAVTVIVASLVGWNSIGTAAFLFELGLVGLILPEIFEMKLSVEKTVGFTTCAVLTTGAVMLAMYSVLSTTSPWAVVSDYLEKSLNLALSMYRETNAPGEDIDMFARSLEEILYLTVRILPAILIVTTLFVVWSNLLIARFLLQRKHLFCPDFGKLNQWKAPEYLIWVAIASGVLLLFGHTGLKTLSINGLIVMSMIYFFQGIAIVSFYFEKKQFSRVLRGILYGLIAMQQLVLLVVIAVGFFDMWFDFRRTRKVES